MKINIFNENLEKVANIEDRYISCLWSEGYSTVEPFTLELPSSEFTRSVAKTGYYVGRQDRKTLMLVEGCNISNSTAVLTGREAKQTLDDVAMLGTIYAGNTIDTAISQAYNRSNKWHKLNFPEGKLTDKVVSQISNASFLQVCEQNSVESDVGFRVVKNNDHMDVEFYKPQNSPYVLSQEFGTLNSTDITENIQGEKNYAIVLGMDLTYDRYKVIVDLTNGGKRKELVVDARDIQPNDGYADDIDSRLRQRGLEKLMEHRSIHTIKVNANKFFGSIVDLGDWVEIRFGKEKYIARIVRFQEKSQQNQTEIIIDVGQLRKRG